MPLENSSAYRKRERYRIFSICQCKGSPYDIMLKITRVLPNSFERDPSKVIRQDRGRSGQKLEIWTSKKTVFLRFWGLLFSRISWFF